MTKVKVKVFKVLPFKAQVHTFRIFKLRIFYLDQSAFWKMMLENEKKGKKNCT